MSSHVLWLWLMKSEDSSSFLTFSLLRKMEFEWTILNIINPDLLSSQRKVCEMRHDVKIWLLKVKSSTKYSQKKFWRKNIFESSAWLSLHDILILTHINLSFSDTPTRILQQVSKENKKFNFILAFCESRLISAIYNFTLSCIYFQNIFQ